MSFLSTYLSAPPLLPAADGWGAVWGDFCIGRVIIMSCSPLDLFADGKELC